MKKRMKPNEPSVISEPMDEELVVINLESGCYYNLNPSASKIWSSLESGASMESILAAQKANGHDPQEVAEVLGTFFQYLQDENLMTAIEADENESPVEAMDYAKPTIEKFTDMQEMLLLDPIHEVSEMGWPHEAQKP